MNPLLLLAPRLATNRLWARAGAVPSFDINPGELGHVRDLLTGTTLGGGTVNCAAPAWDTGPDGIVYQPAANSPVIGYDPVTLRPLGLRLWELLVNRSLSTRDLTQAVWVKSSVTATRDQTGADGTANTATRLTATASDGTCLQTLTSASATHVSGFYVRRITGTGTVEITQDGGATWTAITLTSAFQRFAVAAATIVNPQIGFRIRSNGDQIAVDFTQCQSASVLGPPLPNASTTLTASSTADVISVTGADFTRIWNQSAVTMYAEAVRDVVPGGEFPVLIDARSTGIPQVVQISYLLESIAGMFAGTSAGTQAELYPAVGGRTRRVAAAFAQDNFAISANGQSVLVDSSGAMPTPDRMFIGSVGVGQFLNGYIRRATIFRSRRPNANLQALTS